MSKLIPKHQAPSEPLILQNDNTQVIQPVLPIPAINIDWTLKAPDWNDKNIYTTFIPVGYFLSTNKSNR